MMTKREVNGEGLEKSFASNSLGEKRTQTAQYHITACHVLSTRLMSRVCVLSYSRLHPHQESHSTAGEES